jgi:class 3 adenylate cyclase/tetratricopeptide (TPR) repeat protein
MPCPRCRHENPPQAKFCLECGGPLARRCAQCATDLPAGAKFCLECGLPVGTPTASGRFSSPDAYTPKHLAERILTSRSALEGERKQVTVLFADLKGSMELLADRDPEEARKILDPVLERMMEAVHRYEGTVNQVMGDGIMALFGAPLAHEDHAVRACYAALRMRDAVRRYSDELRRAQGVEAQIRVGLNSGEVVVRSIGSDLRLDYTAVGQTTHLAARMEQLAAPGTVRLTSGTLRLAEGYVEVRSLGPVPVKGLPDPIEIFELTGAGQARTRLQAAALRGLTRFVGRDAEVEHLRRVLGQAGTGHGQVAAIVGEAGVGKSRLTYEFTHSHRVQDWLILEASSVSYGKATSYLPVIDLLKGYFKIGDRDTHREMRDKVMGRVLGLDRALEPLLSPLLGLLDVPVEDVAWQSQDALQRRQRTLDAVKRVLLRESQVQPLLVVFEDLHWVDSETQALLDSLVDSLGSARVLLLVNYRPEYQHGWGSKTSYSQMRLDALASEGTGALLEALLGDDPSVASLNQLLVKRGNPFFLEETVRMLVETNALEGSPGRYRLTQPLQALQAPPTVQTILAARIDRLAPEEKRLLQTASVVGKDVPFALLQAIAELSDEALRGGLDRLRAAEFLYETGLFPDLEYTFKHALTHEVTYGSLLQERRRILHAQLVGAIERLHADRLGEQIERLAHHAFQGEVWERAVAYLRQAGTRAAAHSAHRAAVAWFEQALSALQRMPETRETQEQSVDVRLDLRNAHWTSGELGKLFPSLREAERLARTLGDQRRLGWVLVYMGHYLLVTGDWSQARACAENAEKIGTSFGDVTLTALARYYLGWGYHTAGDFLKAEDFLRKVVHGWQASMDPRLPGSRSVTALAVTARWSLAISLGERGAFQEAITQAEDGVRIAETVEHAYAQFLGPWGLGHVCSLKGDLSRASPMLERALALSRGWNFPIQSAYIAAQLGYVYALSKRVTEGLALVRQAAADLESTGVVAFHSLVVGHLSEAYRLGDRLDDAHAAAARGLRLARERGERGREADALRLLGDVAAHRERLDFKAADGHYLQAQALASELGMRPLAAHCHLGLGRLAGQTGDAEKARKHLTMAAAMYREMDMGFWLEKAEAELRLPP